MSFTDSFDLFTDCYVYGCIAYITALFVYHLTLSLLSLIDDVQQTKQSSQLDFYGQVKELLDPTDEINVNDSQKYTNNLTTSF